MFKPFLVGALCLGSSCAALEPWVVLNPKPVLADWKSGFFLNSQVGYVAGTHGSMIKTVDGGNAWSLLQRDGIGELSFIHFTDAQTGYAAGSGRVLKTTDGGTHWFRTGEAYGALHSLQVSKTGVLHAVNDSGHILKSSDGATWSRLASTPLTGRGLVHFISPASGIASSGSKVFTTADGGAHWTPGEIDSKHALTEFAFPGDRIGFALAYGFETLGDSRPLVGRIYKTSDGGAHWDVVHSAYIEAPTGGMVFHDTLNGLVSSNGGYVYRTVDGGRTWSAAATGLGDGLPALAAAGSDILFGGGSNGLLAKSTDGGKHWTRLSSALTEDLVSVFFSHPDTGVALGNDGLVAFTGDGGRTWKPVDTLDPSLMDVHKAPSGPWIAVGMNGDLFRSADGMTWSQPLSRDQLQEHLIAVHFPTASTGYVASTAGSVFRITQGGLAATRIPVVDVPLYDVHFPDSLTGYVVGEGGVIARTGNGGGTWIRSSVGTAQDLYSVHFPAPGIGYAAGDNGTVLKTSDGGVTWRRLATGTVASMRSVHFTHPDTGYAQGFGILLVTRNGGNTWAVSDSGSGRALYSLHFPQGSMGYRVGRGGLVLKLDASAEPVPIRMTGMQERAIPCAVENGWLHFALKRRTFVEARLFDMRGKLVLSLDGVREAGANREYVFARPLPPGRYLLHFREEDTRRAFILDRR